MTAAESMALAVLKGDMIAARALADHLTGELAEGPAVPPVAAFRVGSGKLKAVVRPAEHGGISPVGMRVVAEGVADWLSGRIDTMVLPPGWTVELYEIGG